jgi:plastocyanin
MATEPDPQVGLADAAAPGDAGAPGDAAAAVVTVHVRRASFEPSDVTVHPGDTVRWVWERGRHNVVSGTVQDDKGVADGKFCNPGADTCDAAPLQGVPYTYEHTFQEIGAHPYFCTPHISMGMLGTIRVVT